MKDKLKKFFKHPAVEWFGFAVIWTVYSYIASIIYADAMSSFFLTVMVWGPDIIMWTVFVFILLETYVGVVPIHGAGSWFTGTRKSKGIYDDIGIALIAHGWKLDPDPNINSIGECKEFIHPTTEERFAWLDAVHKQEDIEYEKLNEHIKKRIELTKK